MDPRLAPLFSDDHPLARVRPHLVRPTYAVGGVVRDVLLRTPPGNDIDLVVESDALPLAQQLAQVLGGNLTVHDRFQTAVVALADGPHIDVIAARRETYSRPGALPDVVAGTLADDLARRDFTINAMAVDVGPGSNGSLIDLFDGADDLAAGLVRTLRADAFVEDPSRVVRAVRYAARLGFRLQERTAAAAADQAPRLEWSSARVVGELERLLLEDDAQVAVELLHELGAPGLAARPPAFSAIAAALAQPGAPAIPAWVLRLGAAFAPGARDSMALDGRALNAAEHFARGVRLAASIGELSLPSQVDRVLSSMSEATAVGARVAGAAQVDAWWKTHRDTRLAIGGGDLLAAGIESGPRIGAGLAAARTALLDGGVTDADQQLAIAVSAAKQAPPR